MSDKNYSDTVLLPRTPFNLITKPTKLKVEESKRLEIWKKEGAYTRIREARAGKDKYVVHSGPPYANGDFHAGHVLPSVLKSIAVESNNMKGYDAAYVPGSDAHGLPIEWEVEKQEKKKGRNRADIPDKEFIQLCREYAEKWIERQMQAWQRMGGQADWENPYDTKKTQTEADIYKVFADVARSGLLRRGERPVMWSVAEQTSLADAEIEHKDMPATSCYFSFPLIDDTENAELVSWTTTPWSIPSNKAVAVSAEDKYVRIKLRSEGKEKNYIIAAELLEKFVEEAGLSSYEVKSLEGRELEGQKCSHPLFKNISVPVVTSSHVTMESGTGIVHIAPAHGPEDFEVGQENNLDADCKVDEHGCYTSGFPAFSNGYDLTGKKIHQAEEEILFELASRGHLLAQKQITHSYPISWRSKQPLIYRTAPQWFIEMDKPFGNDQKTLRERALSNIETVQWSPASGKNTMKEMVAKRPDWCISRQRKWGVPIAVFKNKITNKYILDPDVLEHIAAKLEESEQGVFDWYTLDTKTLLPDGWLEKNNVAEDDLEKETDILDVWFDSGASYSFVLQNGPAENNFPADLYLEGQDQYRGWFMSSLLLSTITTGMAPYKQVVSHKFVVDENGRKLSKSQRNGSSAESLMDKYGTDVVRLWVASADPGKDLKLSEEHFKGVKDSYQKIRNTIRFMLANFDEELDGTQQEVNYDDLPDLEKYILAKAYRYFADIREAYDSFEFNKAYRNLMTLCNDLSNFYFDVRKDSLYCDTHSSHERRSTITALSSMFNGLVTHASPILPFVADNAWRTKYGDDNPIYTETFAVPDARHNRPDIIKSWEPIMGLRSQVGAEIDTHVKAGRQWAKKSEYTQAQITMPAYLHEKLEDADLALVFKMSKVELVKKPYAKKIDVKLSEADGQECRRCRTVKEEVVEDLCTRCEDAIEGFENGPA